MVSMFLSFFRYNSNKDVFASDARQIFSNCSYYNEDNSEVRSFSFYWSDNRLSPVDLVVQSGNLNT